MILRVTLGISTTVLMLGPLFSLCAQSNASIQGEVTDQNGAVVPAVAITVRSEAIGIDRKTTTDSGGRYLIAALPVGDYQLEAQANGFTRQIFEGIRVEVGRAITKNFQLQVGDV